MPQIERDNQVSVTADRRRQDMPVTVMRDLERGNQIFEARNQASKHRLIHALPRSLQRFRAKIRPVPEKIPDPFLMNQIGPSRAKQPGAGKADQKIAQGRRIQDAGVVKGNQGRQGSVSHVQLLGLPRKSGQCFFAPSLGHAFIAH